MITNKLIGLFKYNNGFSRLTLQPQFHYKFNYFRSLSSLSSLEEKSNKKLFWNTTYDYTTNPLPIKNVNGIVFEAYKQLHNGEIEKSYKTFLQSQRQFKYEEYHTFSLIFGELIEAYPMVALDFFENILENDKESFRCYIHSKHFIKDLRIVHLYQPHFLDKFISLVINSKYIQSDPARINIVSNIRSIFAEIGRLQDAMGFDISNTPELSKTVAKNIISSMIDNNKLDTKILERLSRDLKDDFKLAYKLYPALQFSLYRNNDRILTDAIFKMLLNNNIKTVSMVGRLWFFNLNQDNKEICNYIVSKLVESKISIDKFEAIITVVVQLYLYNSRYSEALEFMFTEMDRFNYPLTIQLVLPFLLNNNNASQSYWTYKEKEFKTKFKSNSLKEDYENLPPDQVYKEISKYIPNLQSFQPNNNNNLHTNDELVVLADKLIVKEKNIEELIEILPTLPKKSHHLFIGRQFIADLMRCRKNTPDTVKLILEYFNRLIEVNINTYKLYSNHLVDALLRNLFSKRYLEDGLKLAKFLVENNFYISLPTAIEISYALFDLSIPINSKENEYHQMFISLSQKFPDIFQLNLIPSMIANSKDNVKKLNQTLTTLNSVDTISHRNISLRLDVLFILYPIPPLFNLKYWTTIPNSFLSKPKLMAFHYEKLVEKLIEVGHINILHDVNNLPNDFLLVATNECLKLLFHSIPNSDSKKKLNLIYSAIQVKPRSFHPSIQEYFDNLQGSDDNIAPKSFQVYTYDTDQFNKKKEYNSLDYDIVTEFKSSQSKMME